MTLIRKQHGKNFKAKIALEAVKGEKTLSQIGKEHSVHPLQVSKWKKELLDHAGDIFVDHRLKSEQISQEKLIEELYAKIGRLEVENDFLKKKSGM